MYIKNNLIAYELPFSLNPNSYLAKNWLVGSQLSG